jgi:hypothetical protein
VKNMPKRETASPAPVEEPWEAPTEMANVGTPEERMELSDEEFASLTAEVAEKVREVGDRRGLVESALESLRDWKVGRTALVAMVLALPWIKNSIDVVHHVELPLSMLSTSGDSISNTSVAPELMTHEERAIVSSSSESPDETLEWAPDYRPPETKEALAGQLEGAFHDFQNRWETLEDDPQVRNLRSQWEVVGKASFDGSPDANDRLSAERALLGGEVVNGWMSDFGLTNEEGIVVISSVGEVASFNGESLTERGALDLLQDRLGVDSDAEVENWIRAMNRGEIEDAGSELEDVYAQLFEQQRGVDVQWTMTYDLVPDHDGDAKENDVDAREIPGPDLPPGHDAVPTRISGAVHHAWTIPQRRRRGPPREALPAGVAPPPEEGERPPEPDGPGPDPDSDSDPVPDSSPDSDSDPDGDVPTVPSVEWVRGSQRVASAETANIIPIRTPVQRASKRSEDPRNQTEKPRLRPLRGKVQLDEGGDAVGIDAPQPGPRLRAERGGERGSWRRQRAQRLRNERASIHEQEQFAESNEHDMEYDHFLRKLLNDGILTLDDLDA